MKDRQGRPYEARPWR